MKNGRCLGSGAFCCIRVLLLESVDVHIQHDAAPENNSVLQRSCVTAQQKQGHKQPQNTKVRLVKTDNYGSSCSERRYIWNDACIQIFLQVFSLRKRAGLSHS